MAQTSTANVLARETCGDVITVRLSRPAGYEFVPGQWFRLTLQTAEGAQTETFSHVSAPLDPYLELTTRMSRSAFKAALSALPIGASTEIAGPGGRRLVPEDAEKVAFLVGGVGITPARSILRDAEQRGHTFADALVLYGNRREECIAYRDELEHMTGVGVRVVLCLEEPPEGWVGERGFITAELVRRHLDVGDGRSFLVSGPPLMVEAMEAVLDELGVPSEHRMVERFGPRPRRPGS